MKMEIRCPNRLPDGKLCYKKLGDYLLGVYETTCPRCHQPVRIQRLRPQRVEVVDKARV